MSDFIKLLRSKRNYIVLFGRIVCLAGFSVTDQTADRIALLEEFLFVFGHNVIRCRTVGVQIEAAFVEDPSGLLDLLQREIEQRTVIGFELDHAIRCQETVVPLQKLAGGQTALGMAVLWPWIGEVEVDFLNLARRKIFVNIFGVHAQKRRLSLSSSSR